MFDTFNQEFVVFRDKAEAFFSSAFKTGLTALKTIVTAVGKTAIPVLQQAGVIVLQAVQEAHKNGTPINSHEMVDVGLKAIREQAPALEATVGAAVVSDTIEVVKQALAQKADQAPPPSITTIVAANDTAGIDVT